MIETSELQRLVSCNIATIRRDLGMTQEEFARKAQTSVPYICQIEQGEKNLTLKSIEKICWALEISPQDLFSENFYYSRRPVMQSFSDSSAEASYLLSQFDALPVERKEKIFKIWNATLDL